MSAEPRVPLYDRLPEIYRVEDARQSPPYQLRAFLELVEGVFSEIHANIESRYHDLFIETCDDWVIPYIGDLLGTSHLAGDPWTLRADVANTIALRRRKGTLGAVEWLAYSLTRWGVHAAELRDSLVWAQHLNHQRPDAGGEPPYGLPTVDRHTVIRGGTAPVRDPSTLSLLGTAFDPFAHLPDLRVPAWGALRHNLPNLAIFLWRLQPYTVPLSRPLWKASCATGEVAPRAAFSVHFEVHPLDRPLRLFNRFEFDPDRRPPVVTELDATPGPILPARLDSLRPPMYEGPTAPAIPAIGDLWHDTGASPPVWKQWDGGFWQTVVEAVVDELVGGGAGNPNAYLGLDPWDPADPSTLERSDQALQLHIPEAPFAPFNPEEWSFRGADLSEWEVDLGEPLGSREVAVDPVLGRLAIGVDSQAQADVLRDDLRISFTYAAVGPVGAHPISRDTETPATIVVDSLAGPPTLQDALANLDTATDPVVIEIRDSSIHELDLGPIPGTQVEDGGPNLMLGESLTIRAGDDQRPIIRLAQPLRFRPVQVLGANPAEQAVLDAAIGRLKVRLEGLYISRGAGFVAGDPLIARAAVHALEVYDSTLDPDGTALRDGSGRQPIFDGMRLAEPYGFPPAAEAVFKETPEIHLSRSVSGPLLVDPGYRIFLTESILDAGSGPGEEPATAAFALSGATGAADASWGPPTQVDRLTVLGRMRVETLAGRGGIWSQRLEVLNNQVGCIRFSYFSDGGNRLPQNHGCVDGSEAALRFVSEIFEAPAYGQLGHVSDFRVRERGPQDDAMGAFGFLLEAHKWRNLQIRFREFMPVGVRPLLVPVT